MIKILDCTLRDGGYINNWQFGFCSIKSIVNLLLQTNIDFIELGFLTNKMRTNEHSLFNSFDDIRMILPSHYNANNLCAMIKYGEFCIENIIDSKFSSIKNIRVIYRKVNQENVFDFAKRIKDKGYNVFINPTYINEYSINELIYLCTKINEINPCYLSIVDTLGTLGEKETLEIYNILHCNLNKNIGICYHSHNNLQLSFLNAKSLIEQKNRELIIDSSIYGMGRGAGNIQTEFLIKYLNDNFQKEYNIIPALKVLNDEIMPIYNKISWGYSTPYYISAVNHCHPNYAKFLQENNIQDVELMNKILKDIPEKNRTLYDSNLIMDLLLKHTFFGKEYSGANCSD